MKKITALAAVLVLMLGALSACAKTDAGAPITVNSTPVDEAVFRYYLDEAFDDPTYPDKAARVDYATRQCIRYVAVNTAFLGRGLSLSAARRAAVSEETNALWRIFGAHYEKVGVDKQTLYKLRTSMAFAEGLRDALFDTGGSMPVAESALQAYFAANYLAVRYLTGYLYTTDAYGVAVRFSDEQIAAFLGRFNDAAAQVNAGAGLEVIYAALAAYGDQDIRQNLTTEVVKIGDPSLPQSFYAAAVTIPAGGAGVCVVDNAVYLIQRIGMEQDLSWFQSHRAACLKAVSEPALQNEINALCSAYTSVRRSAAVSRCYDTVSTGR